MNRHHADNDNYEYQAEANLPDALDMALQPWQVPGIKARDNFYAVDGRYLADILEEGAA